MDRLFDAYRSLHEQAFIPIFAQSGYNSKLLLEACLEAGLRCIEYTLRREDAHRMIPWIRDQYPELFVLAGSTLDDDGIVARSRRHYPQLMTLAQLDALGVDGFVSMIGWSLESIRKYSSRRLVIPVSMTVTEAFQQIGAGAHFVKLMGTDLGFVRKCRAAATFDFCPIFCTGGVDRERIPEAVSAGAVLTGAGFDVILKGQSAELTAGGAAEILRGYVSTAREARDAKWPQLADANAFDRQTWLDKLPHHHHF